MTFIYFTLNNLRFQVYYKELWSKGCQVLYAIQPKTATNTTTKPIKKQV